MPQPPLVCLPGQRLCPADAAHLPGRGAYERHGYLHASLAGAVELAGRVVEVRRLGAETVVPGQGDVVTAQVQAIGQAFARCAVRCVGARALGRPYRGILRREDVRAAEKDRVEIYKCFRPGDVILARVLPITEAHTYQLSTAENELGVVIAHSEHGHAMVPVSWSEMQCTRTLVKEPRKVARVVPESVHQTDGT